jgi:hypothetical protein
LVDRSGGVGEEHFTARNVPYAAMITPSDLGVAE